MVRAWTVFVLYKGSGLEKESAMRKLVVMAIAVAVAAVASGSPADAGKKVHRSHYAVQSRGPVIDPTGGNAAAGGNNANSMNGSNSAGENAEGRTGGSRG
jgi:hypothetical protein